VVSVNADSCPHCGAVFLKRKQHGVFYYVFWGVVSLAVTCFILLVGVPAAFMASGAFMRARERAQTRAASTNAPPQDEKLNYVRTSLKLYDFEARYYETTLEEKVAGVTFKMRNAGNRTLDEVEVTIYFKDSHGVTITEEKYYPVLVSRFNLEDKKPLKPNYIWQLESGKFYTAKRVPSEWKEGSAEALITHIQFAKAGSD
jgi:hypothetical protein